MHFNDFSGGLGLVHRETGSIIDRSCRYEIVFDGPQSIELRPIEVLLLFLIAQIRRMVDRFDATRLPRCAAHSDRAQLPQS
jgi:hypothetical protein